MTNMKRVTIALPDEMDERILRLRQNENYMRCTYSEMVRRALACGLDRLTSQQQAQQESA